MSRVPILASLTCLVALAACTATPSEDLRSERRDGPGRSPSPSPTASADPAAGRSPTPRPTPSPTPEAREPLTLAFAGDIHFEDQLAARLDDPARALEPIAPALTDADLTVVNLETAIATEGRPEDKNYTFRTPPTALEALAAAGVDIVTMANNHGVDYGRTGLEQTLAAKQNGPVDVIGIGEDADDAFAPAVRDVGGTKIAVLGATAFPLDPTVERWPAEQDRPGIAVAIDPTRLLQEVRAARKTADLVVVYVHWGTERESCPNATQRRLADRLAEAGADIIVGSHAHVLQGAGRLTDDTFVAYGLGNFVWYSRNSDREATTGVLKLTLDGRRVEKADWTPAKIAASGLPEPATGTESARLTKAFWELRSCTNLAAVTKGPESQG